MDPKLIPAPVDVERLVRNLLDAFESIKAKRAPLTCATVKEPVSDQQQERPAPAPSFNDPPNSTARGFQIEVKSTEDETVQRFGADRESIRRVEATPPAPNALSRESSIGPLPRKPDAPSIQGLARQVSNPLQLRETFSLEQIQRRYHKVEPSIPYLREVSETLRRAALARLEVASLKAAEHRATPWRRIYTMLIWRTPSSSRFGTRSRQL